MGTLRGYSVNKPRIISMGLLANVTLAQDPQLSEEKLALLRHASLKRWIQTRKTSNKSSTIYPEQGLFCSQVISRKGSQLPSEAEYLRAVNQRRVRTIVKSDQHHHRKDARRQRRNAIYL